MRKAEVTQPKKVLQKKVQVLNAVPEIVRGSTSRVVSLSMFIILPVFVLGNHLDL
jgi:CxxC motif-containing protein